MILDILDAIKSFFTDTLPDFFRGIVDTIRKIDLKKIHFTRKESIISLAGFFAFLFLFSFLLFFIEKGNMQRYVLFFPDKFSGKLMGEERFVKNGKDREHSLKSLFEEILLGPGSKSSSPVFSKKTEVVSLVLIRDHAYVNLSKEVLFPDRVLPLDVIGGFRACINSMKYNFPWIKQVSFFISGEELILKIAENAGTEKNSRVKEVIRFDPGLLK